MGGESGQATVEWVGLVLVAALVLGALTTFRGPVEEHALGTALAKRIRCAAAGSCIASGGAGSTGAVAAPPRVATGPGAAGVPMRAGAPRDSRAKAVDAFRRLRGVRVLGKRLWIVCLGYRRFRYELEHPLAPTETMPLRDALEIANDCLNPLAFLGDG